VHSFGQSDVDLPAASTIKALVLGCTLAGLQDRGSVQPDAATADLLHRMISVSDNDATTTLVDALGGAPALRPCANRFGASAITINPNGWGVTQVPPESFVRILRNLLRVDSTVLDAGWVAYARSLMLSSNIVSGERWGIGAGLPSGSTFWVKDGWWTTGPADFRYPGNRINSIGMIETSRDWWIIAIQGDRYASQQRGIAATELIATSVNRTLDAG
jgi:beta-lactamase class A